MADKDAHWIEHAKLKKGAYGHHSAATISRDSKKKGTIGRRARLAHTLESLHSRGSKKLYGK
jgi:hypothetical protein